MQRKWYFGHVLTFLAVCTSWVFSVRGAYEPALGWGCVALIAMACFAEPAKYVALRVILKAASPTRGQRWMAALWYVLCVLVSLGLMHRNMDRNVNAVVGVELAQQRQQAELAKQSEQAVWTLRVQLKEAEDAEEAARSAIVPGPRSVAVLRQELSQAQTLGQRKALQADLAQAILNEQALAKAERSHVKVLEINGALSAERSRAFTQRPTSPGVQNAEHGIQNVQNAMNTLMLVAAILVEAAIVGGVWSDGVGNQPAPPAAPQEAQIIGVQRVEAARFEAWLRREWKANRSKDGWLEGTQQSWGRSTKHSAGFVHGQLERLVSKNIIEKRTSSRNTWIRFRKTAELSVVE